VDSDEFWKKSLKKGKFNRPQWLDLVFGGKVLEGVFVGGQPDFYIEGVMRNGIHNGGYEHNSYTTIFYA
jgi:hypothetical protein